MNLAKYRKVQSELGKSRDRREIGSNSSLSFVEDSAERADLAENQLGKLRSKQRSSPSAMPSSPIVKKIST